MRFTRVKVGKLTFDGSTLERGVSRRGLSDRPFPMTDNSLSRHPSIGPSHCNAGDVVDFDTHTITCVH